MRLCLKKNLWNFWFSRLVSPFLKYKKFFKLGTKKFHFPKYRKLFKSEFFSFFECRKLLPQTQGKYKVHFYFYFLKFYFRYVRILNIPFLKYKKSSVKPGFRIYLSWNIRKFRYARVLNIPFLKYKKSSVSWKLEKLF